MPMRLHDTLSRDLKDFPSDHDGPVTIYACGPTVYHYAHIGNLRTFLTVDLLRRYLEYRGKKVKLVMNITDVGHMLNDAEKGEDKIEAAAKKEGKTQEEIAAFYTKAFFSDLKALNFKIEPGVMQAALEGKPYLDGFPRATENVEGESGMIELVKRLLDKGLAYPTEQGDVYYDVAKFGNYGQLSGNAVEALRAGARVEVQDDKRHPADFALWIHNEAHQMQWAFDWKNPATGEILGFKGYPGWHLECSAMAQKYLGKTIDLHCGGEDLKFPHHECEIAQSEGATGETFARHWLHVTYLLVDGEKMSKSKGNFYTLQDLLDKGYSAEAIRMLLLSTHYRSQLNFTLAGLDATKKAIRRFQATTVAFKKVPADVKNTGRVHEHIDRARDSIAKALDEDLNVSHAIAEMYAFQGGVNKLRDFGNVGPKDAAAVLDFMQSLDNIFGFGFTKELIEEAHEEVSRLLEERGTARAEKRWTDSDRLRDEIAAKGWIVEDTPQGQKLRKA